MNWESLLATQIRENGRLLYRLAYGILHDAAAAEDVCQQAMLRACECRLELREPASIRSWLARVVVNEGLTLRRRRQTEKRVLCRTIVPGPEAPMQNSDLPDIRDAVLAAVEKLPEEERLVVVLRLIEGQSGKQVKALIGCSDSEVSKRLHRGMEKLRRALVEWQTV